MNRLLTIVAASAMTLSMNAQQIIRISTDKTDLVFQVNEKNRLYQVYLGEKLLNPDDYKLLKWNVRPGNDGSMSIRGHEAYAASGGEDYFEPAVAITHADGNQTTYLYYKGVEQRSVNGGTETLIRLADDQYKDEVVLHYVAYPKENVIKLWSEITNREGKPITLWRYNSGILYFKANRYFLTEYHSDWAREGQPEVQELKYGKKIVDTKLGTRANLLAEPFFELGLDGKPQENEGRVLLGNIGWTGNFQYTMEVDNTNTLRLIPGINPYASNYVLDNGETFTTPEFVFTLSDQGTGLASRNLHEWCRRYDLRDGMGSRMTLLNNWENTGFNFNQQTLAELMKDAKDLGVEMFLLDDGWFGNKYPRKDDRQGLGDWEATTSKLPQGIPGMVSDAKKAGVKFGIWVEPEMISPKSELYEKHPDWAIELPNRETYYYRNQLVLDLSNPKVQDYVFGVIDRIMTENPDVAYMKWDCNSPITNIFSHYLGRKQGNLYVDYVRGLYKVCERVNEKYPNLAMMLCSGGGGRCDYEALKHFTEFWCSDDTDPFERIYIQWSMSKFFPAKAMASHVTNWNKQTSVKFRFDVCSMVKLGFDIDLKSLSADEYKFLQNAVAEYKSLEPVIFDGNQYRLVSPYESNHCALNYVSQDQTTAVLYTYNLHPRFGENLNNVRLQGLNPSAQYKITEIYRMPGDNHNSEYEGQTFSGDYLMKVGLNVLSANDATSHVYKLEAR
ncbi:MAG: alpha-galactosidase [Prevotella sp.]|jgi:alpha-galactosidase